jgi:hypothetical protein
VKVHGGQTLILVIIALVASRAQDTQQPDWSVKSTALPAFWDSNSKFVALPARDGNLTLMVAGKKTGGLYPEDKLVPDYFLERGGHRLRPALHPYTNPYALWSPDSDLLSITSSDGGAVGNWKVYVYSVEGDAVVKHDVMRQVQSELARVFPAGVDPFFSQREREQFARDPSWVNVFAVRWLSNPERLLVLASVPPSSRYGANLGKHRGYIVEPRTGHILHRCKETEFTQRNSVCGGITSVK